MAVRKFRYHIPRSYLKNTGDNTLVLFEEFGGGPLDIDIQTTRVRKVCAKPYEGSTLELSCHDRTISDIKFVSFGNPRGSCENFQKGSCDSSTAFSVIKKVEEEKISHLLFVKWLTFFGLCIFVGFLWVVFLLNCRHVSEKGNVPLKFQKVILD